MPQKGPSSSFSFRKSCYLFFCGALIGACDLLPGISGGTCAFVLGVYETLLGALRSFRFSFLFSGRLRCFLRALAWQTLLALGTGALLSWLLLPPFLFEAFNDASFRTYLFATFFGLIAGSIWLTAKEIRQWKSSHFLAIGGGIAAALLLTFFPAQKGKLCTVECVKPLPFVAANYDPLTKELSLVPVKALPLLYEQGMIAEGQSVLPHSSPYVSNQVKLLMSGVLAVVAMLLPGISGSYLLLILGVYPLLLTALAKREFFLLLPFGVGVVLGAFLFSRLILALIRRSKEIIFAGVTGFLLGSIHTVWPFWIWEYQIDPFHIERGAILVAVEAFLPQIWTSTVGFCLFFALSGFLAIWCADYCRQQWRTNCLMPSVNL